MSKGWKNPWWPMSHGFHMAKLHRAYMTFSQCTRMLALTFFRKARLYFILCELGCVVFFTAAITCRTVGDLDVTNDFFITRIYVFHLYMFSLKCHISSTFCFEHYKLMLCCRMLLWNVGRYITWTFLSMLALLVRFWLTSTCFRWLFIWVLQFVLYFANWGCCIKDCNMSMVISRTIFNLYGLTDFDIACSRLVNFWMLEWACHMILKLYVRLWVCKLEVFFVDSHDEMPDSMLLETVVKGRNLPARLLLTFERLNFHVV